MVAISESGTIKYKDIKMPKTVGAHERVPWNSEQFEWSRHIFDRRIHELRGIRTSEARNELFNLRSITRRQQRAIMRRRGGEINGRSTKG